MNIFSLLDFGASRYPTEPAIFSGYERHCSWAELRSRSLALAQALKESCQPTARVAIIADNCPEYIEILFAVWAAGLVAVPINAKLHPREATDILTDCAATVLFIDTNHLRELEEIVRLAAPELRLICIGASGYNGLIQGDSTDPAIVDPEDIAWLFYTSGTTGRSKGAMLSHRNLMAMTIAHLADFEALSFRDSILHAAPMSHGSGLYILPYVARAARQLIPASGAFDPREVLKICAHHKRVGMFLAPTMVQRLRLTVEESGSKAEGLRHIIYGGGPMYLDEIKRSISTFGPIFSQLYGQGEAPMTIAGLRTSDYEGADDALLTSVGWPRSGVKVAVVDDRGEALPSREIGEIVCRGDVIMKGYWNNPGATSAALRNGWLYTGDVGSLDADGKLTLKDRSKDVIISGGSNIYPREVEDALLTHPDVREACAIGQIDAEWGEIVVAFIVREHGSQLSEAELDQHCLAQIARFKRPKRYIFVDSLPKNSSGKVVKRSLASTLAP
ncbi:AMP-binding protein [Rhizorhabdus argentea]|uniref:AMP-binding protein n=1 Tax=Rhizorhabdus argentea TaxID=1387174 RepID=UPI0030EB54E4